MFTKSFSVGSDGHTTRTVLGLLQPHYFVLTSKMFFFLQNAKGKSVGFLEMCLNCLIARHPREWSSEAIVTVHQDRGKGQINNTDDIHLFHKDS